MAAGNTKAFKEIEPSLPIFHTRAMRKHFFADFSLFCCARPAVLKEIYRQLTGKDASRVLYYYCNYGLPHAT